MDELFNCWIVFFAWDDTRWETRANWSLIVCRIANPFDIT